MVFEEEFREFMPQTVTIAAVSATDAFGDRTYAAAITYDARVLEEQKIVTDFRGREVTSVHVVWVAPHLTSGLPNLTPEAQITLPDGSTPPMLSYSVVPDEDGDHHAKIWLGGSN